MAPQIPTNDMTSMAAGSIIKAKISKPRGTKNKSSKVKKEKPSKKLSDEDRLKARFGKRWEKVLVDRRKFGNLKNLPQEIRERIWVNVYGRQILQQWTYNSLATGTPLSKMTFATKAIKDESMRNLYAEGLIELSLNAACLGRYLRPDVQYGTRAGLGAITFTSSMARNFVLGVGNMLCAARFTIQTKMRVPLYFDGWAKAWFDGLKNLVRSRPGLVRIMVFDFNRADLTQPGLTTMIYPWIKNTVRIISEASANGTAFYLRDRNDKDSIRVAIETLLPTAANEDNYPIA